MEDLAKSLDQEELREMFVSLLASEMNADLRGYVHPSFPFIVSQLCPDEAKLLYELSKDTPINLQFPVVKFEAYLPDKQKLSGGEGRFPIVNHWMSVEKSCDLNQEMIPAYLENLQKQGLIQISYAKPFMDESVYLKMADCPLLAEFKRDYPDYKIEMGMGFMAFTNLGLSFLKVCTVSAPESI